MTGASNEPEGPALVGRDEERRALGAALEGPGGVVSGPAGVGKSRLASEAARAVAATGVPVLRSVATRAASSLPFGALAHLLPAAARADLPAIPDLLARLQDRRGGPRPLLLVDDAHLLDPASAALLLAASSTDAATLLLTVRTGEVAPDAVTALWKERRLPRFDLQALAVAEVRVLVEDLLGGPASTLVHDWAFELSQGNPLYLAELIGDARRSGALEDQEGRWHLVTKGAQLDRLNDLIGAHVAAVSPDAARALEMVAIGAPLPLHHVAGQVGEAAVEELERAHLVALGRGPDDGLVVELAHPLYGEVVVAGLAELTARRIRRDLAAALIADGAGGEADDLRIAGWLLDAGEVDLERFVAASAAALRRGATELADRLATAAHRVADDLAAALAVAQARNALVRFAEVDPILAPHEADAAAAAPEVGAAYVEARYRALLRAEGAQEVAAALLDRCAGWHADADWAALIATQEAWALIYAGRPRSARDRLAPFVDLEGLRADRRFHVLVVSSYATIRLGRVDDSEVLHQRLTALLGASGVELPWEVSIGAQLADVARVNAGRDLRGARNRFEADLARADLVADRASAATARFMLGNLEVMRGDARAAVEHFRAAADLLTVADPLNNRAGVYTSLAWALALIGDPDGADRALAAAAESTLPMQVRRLRHYTERTLAAIEVARGRTSAARDRLLAVAAEAGEDVVSETEALHAALRLGADPSASAARLEALAADAQDESLQLFARHARALADDDGPALLAVAEACEPLELLLVAAEIGWAAAAVSTRHGLRDAARRAAVLAERCAEQCPDVVTPGLAPPLDAPALTAREREIAGLAARGLTNGQIAEALVLSVRSVETYVLRACRKLGVTSRTELSAVLSPEGP